VSFLKWVGAGTILTFVVFSASLFGWLPSQKLQYYTAKAELQRRVWTIEQSYLEPEEQPGFYKTYWGLNGKQNYTAKDGPGTPTRQINAAWSILDSMGPGSPSFGDLTAQLYATGPIWERWSIQSANARFFLWRVQMKGMVDESTKLDLVDKGYLPEKSFMKYAQQDRENLEFIREKLNLCPISNSTCVP
jgi:hypothetical protein